LPVNDWWDGTVVDWLDSPLLSFSGLPFLLPSGGVAEHMAREPSLWRWYDNPWPTLKAASVALVALTFLSVRAGSFIVLEIGVGLIGPTFVRDRAVSEGLLALE